MSKNQKEIKETSETESKKSSKIFLLVFLVAVTALAAIYFLMSDNEKVVENETVEIIEEEKLEIVDTIEVVEEDTTMLEVDMEEVVKKTQDKPVTSYKKKGLITTIPQNIGKLYLSIIKILLTSLLKIVLLV